MQSGSKVFYQLSEIYSRLAGEVEYELRAVEGVFNIHKLHIQPMGGVSEESLPEGFGIDEDSPEGIYEDVADDSDAYDEE